MSIQMGCSYIANVTIAPFFGIIGKNTTFLILPYVVLGILIIFFLTNELVNRLVKKNQVEQNV